MILRDYCKEFHRRSTLVFSDCKEEIAKNNLAMLQKTSIVSLVLLFGYSIATTFIFKSQQLDLIYQVFLLVQAFFALFSFWYRKKENPAYRVVQWMCFGFVLSLMLFATLISIFPFQERPGIFFPVFYLSVLFLFQFPYLPITGLMTAVSILYAFFVYAFKFKSTQAYDWFSTVTVWLLGVFLTLLVLDLRLKMYENELELKSASLVDDLTGLPNRRCFNWYIERAYAQCAARSQAFAVILFDIDDFKMYNDTYGHLAGDACLTQLGSALTAYTQGGDLFIARFGGEEFIVVLTGREAEDADGHAERIRRCVRECGMPAECGARGVITISLGIASVPRAEDCPYMKMIKNADVAMYRAKAGGKDRAERYVLSKVESAAENRR